MTTANTRTVIVRNSKFNILVTEEIVLDWTGRNEPHLEHRCDDGEWYAVSRWTREDGAIDSYPQVLEEAATNGLNPNFKY